MVGILSYTAKLLCITISIALLILVIWQTRRNRDNLILAAYLASVILAQGTNAWTDLKLLANKQDILLLAYISGIGMIINQYIFFLLASSYAEQWQENWNRITRFIGAVLIFISSLLILFGKAFDYYPSTTEWYAYSIELTTLGYIAFSFIYTLPLLALATLWRYHQTRAGKLLIAGAFATVSILTTIMPGLRGTPTDVILLTIACILFAIAVLREKVYQPLIELNANLEAANQNLRHLKDAAEARAEQLDLLNRLTQDITQVHHLPEILQKVTVEMVNIFSARHCGITIVNDERTALTVVADHSSGAEDISAIGVAFPLAESETSRYVLETGQTIVIDNAQTDPRLESIRGLMQQRQTYALMLTPLLARGEVIGTIGIDLDKRQRRFTESEIDLAETIAGQIAGAIENARLLEQMQHARDVAESASRAKSTFLTNMSHELRTPLNAIIGYSEMLCEDAEEAKLSNFARDLRKVQNAGKHLLTLINGILDLSKIEAGRMELQVESFAILPVMEDIRNLIRPLLEKNNNTLTINCPTDIGVMRSDLLKLRQCLFNLLSNATKFTSRGEILLNVRRKQKDSKDIIVNETTQEKEPLNTNQEWISFEVKDSGIGIKSQEIKQLFQPFRQADSSTTRRYGGTGLGLAITRHFCQMMGGDVSVFSEPGKGSTFTIHLPAKIGSNNELKDEAFSVPDEGSRRRSSKRAFNILVIDNDSSARNMLQQKLRHEGFHVTTASNSKEGIRLAHALHPNLITLGVMITNTGFDGWSILNKIKNDPELANIPVITLTIVDDQNLGYIVGAADYLSKPIERQRLLANINQFCQRQSPYPILVVDDDIEIRNVIRRFLEKDGWNVIEASNGREGLEQIDIQKPQLILLDLMMPDMDGFEFIVALRHTETSATLPVIVITAKMLTESEHELLSIHTQKVMYKGSYNHNKLFTEIQRLASHHALTHQKNLKASDTSTAKI